MLLTLLKHKIYESCIDVFFERIMKNFNISKSCPRIGDRYSFIYDTVVGDTLYNCVIVPIEELLIYDDVISAYRDELLDINDIAFGVRYTKYIDDLGELEEHLEYDGYGETTFDYSELEDMIFHK